MEAGKKGYTPEKMFYLDKVKKGDVLVASMTRPEYMPALKKAAATTDEIIFGMVLDSWQVDPIEQYGNDGSHTGDNPWGA